jgi:formate dehydrogenase subunit gamma
MARWLSRIFALALVAILAGMAGAPPGAAQNKDDEKRLLEYLKNCPPGQRCDGRVSIPDAKSGTLVSPAGRPWAERMEGGVKKWGGWFLIAVVVVLAIFYFVRGKVKIDSGLSGRTVERFTGFERFVHWTMASSFIVLALTGLNIRFGRDVVMPIFGPEGFTWLSTWGKVLHNYVAFAFMASLILTFVVWVRHNFPDGTDGKWIAAGGGVLKKGVHPAAKKFNFGQKIVFWAVIIVGALLSWTGWNMLFEGGTADKAWLGQQIWLHSIFAIALVGLVIAHIYIGSIGMQGAFAAMGTGQVDENWAKEHHSLWYDEVKKSKGAAPAE